MQESGNKAAIEDAPEAGAEARGRGTVASPGKPLTGLDRSTRDLLAEPSKRLNSMHRKQVHRDKWPEFDAFKCEAYPKKLRRSAAVQWAGRARAEHGSIHQFSALTHALSEARVPVEILGALARLITDEVRHAELCARTAETMYPEGIEREPKVFRWPIPKAPWPTAPTPKGEERQETLYWAAEAIMTACCIGETLSKPMLDAIALVSTDELASSVAAQILRDEHFHAAFGWEALGFLMELLTVESKERLQAKLPRRLAGFERSSCCGISIEQIAGSEIVIERTDTPDASPNLGTLTDEQYAMIYFATMEQEILPSFEALGLDVKKAWRERLATT